MKYPLLHELPALLESKLISKRPHPDLPLDIYNYTAGAQFLPIIQWTEAMKDCRGLILDHDGEIIGRPFRKFWNYDQVLDCVPASESFEVWEKLDGSLGIVCYYSGERVVATRGSFDSEQARWFRAYLDRAHSNFYPDDCTWLFEIVYPDNRIVVDYGKRSAPYLLAVLDENAGDLEGVFQRDIRFEKPRRFDGLKDFSEIDHDQAFNGMEGFVVRWESGFRAKVKLAEYKRLHRLITQCSTRTIWELLRSGQGTGELIDRVPVDFRAWAEMQITGNCNLFNSIVATVEADMREAPPTEPRKDFALWAKEKPYPGLLFRLLDGKDISDSVWKLIEPKWATPFRKEAE